MESIVKCKQFVETFIATQGGLPAKNRIKHNLSAGDWKLIAEIVEILAYPFKIMKQMQNEIFTLSDFYGAWLRIELNLKKNINGRQTNLAQKLLVSMDKYKGQLMLNPLMISAVYLDPRFTNTLSKTCKMIAVSKLMELWDCVVKLKIDQQNNIAQNVPNDISDDAEFEQFIIAQEMNACLGDINANNTDQETATNLIRSKLIDFERQPRAPLQTNVVKYWMNKASEEKELFLLSEVIFAIPSSQTRVERTFSTLAYILNPLRGSLSDLLLENILLLKCNKETFYEIIDEELDKF